MMENELEGLGARRNDPLGLLTLETLIQQISENDPKYLMYW
jgi:hypothetical protein